MTPYGPPWWTIFIPFLMMMTPWNVTPKALSIVPDKTLTVETWGLPGCSYATFESEKQTGVTQVPVSASCYVDPKHPGGTSASVIMRFGGVDGYVYRLIVIPYDSNGNRVYVPQRLSVEGWWYMGSNPPPGVQGAPYPPPVR